MQNLFKTSKVFLLCYATMSAKQPCRLVPLLRCAVNKRPCRHHAVQLSRSHATRVVSSTSHTHQGDNLLMTRRHYSNDAIPAPLLDGEVQYPDNIKNIVEQISCLTIAEVADLNKLLKKTLGIQDAPVMAMGSFAAPAAAQEEEDDEDAAAAPKEKTQFTVKLTKFDETSKVKLIKLIKALTSGMNLVQDDVTTLFVNKPSDLKGVFVLDGSRFRSAQIQHAKKFVESAPQAVKSDVSKTEADDVKKQIEEAGGTCEIE